jgi:hypothetical protein
MHGPYSRWIDRWERKLASRDTNRVTRQFEWGLEWLHDIAPGLNPPQESANPALWVSEFVTHALADSDAFYSYSPVSQYRLDSGHLEFTSPVRSPFPENNIVHAQWFPAPRDQGRAVLVLPQWNAGEDGHVGLCRLLNRFGISALRMSLAYHAERKPAGLERADFHVSSNVGRTVHASRQSVIDARACVDWLESRGYAHPGILGTSLGSCVAFLAAVHDTRIRTGIFNHVSNYFGDVVWTGLATTHVRKSFEGHITQADLRHYWSVISPACFVRRLSGREMRTLLIWARHDTSFLPVYSRQVLESFRSLKLDHSVFRLPCAHYTTGQFPFNLIDGLAMCAFAAKHL